MSKSSTLPRRQKVSRKSQFEIRKAMELAALEPRMLLCALHDHGLDDLPNNVGTFSAIHAEVDTDYPGMPADTTGGSTPTTSGASIPVSASAVPVLHSNSDATAKLYLDFSGSSDPTWGSYNPGTTPAYSQDSDTTTFSDAEIASMREIWARVSEKYSPFNIDVTTQNPGNQTDRVTQKMVIGGNGAWLGASAGGVSYVGAFYNSAPNVSFIFTDNLAAGNAKYSSEAAAHEAGHAFGLQHQGTWSGSTLTNEYNPGTSAAAPIMGNSYSATRGLWWNGTPSSSPSAIQDDMAVISGSNNGFGYRADAVGNSITAASSLGSNTSFSGSGIIERTSDADYFSFTTSTGGDLTLNGSPIATGATLDMKLELRNGSNAVIASSDLAGPSAESLTAHLAAGTYYVDIASHGSYGDVGQYTLNGSIVPNVVVTVADPTGLSANAVSATQVNLGWTDNASNETNYLVQRSSDGGVTWNNLATLAADATNYSDTSVGAASTYVYRVQAYNTSVSSNYSNAASVTTPAVPTVPATPINVAGSANSSTQITVVWNDVTTETGYRVQRSGDGVNWTTIGSVAANATSYADSGLTPSTNYSYRVIAFNNAGDSVPSAVVQVRTQAAPVTTTVPAAPTNLRITGGSSTSLILAWNDNSNNESGFSVERWNGFNWVVLGTVPANTTSVQNINLFPYSVYYYRTRAYNSAGYSGYSNVTGARTALFSSLPSSPVQSAPVQSKPAKTGVFSNKPISVF
jgi:hypothetical protein